MRFAELIQMGGFPAVLALGLGALSTLLGVLALAALGGGKRAALTLGVVALAAAGATGVTGVVGTMYGRSQVDAAIAYASPADRELIRRVGYEEAQSVALVGFGASLPGLVLGAIAALAGARRRGGQARSLTGGQPAEDEGPAGAILAMLFTGIAALAAVGAWTTWRAPPPQGRYAFPTADHDSWKLAGSADQVLDEGAAPNRCRSLEFGLRPFFEGEAPPWMPARTIDPSIRWEAASEKCVEAIIASWAAENDPDPVHDFMSAEALLQSPLLQGEAQRRRVEAAAAERTAPAPDLLALLLADGGQPLREALEDAVGDPGPVDDPGVIAEDKAPPVIGAGALPKEVIQRVIRRHTAEIRFCYEKALVKQPSLSGKVMVRFVIGADGRVKDAGATAPPPLGTSDVPACVAARVKTWTFPRPSGGGIVTVNYPFIFKAAQ